MMKKIAEILLIVCFVAAMGAGCIDTLVRPVQKVSFFENRDLAVFPENDREAVMNGAWFSDLETYLADHSAGRITLLLASTKLDLDILHRPVVNDTVVGDNVLLPYCEFDRMNPKDVPQQVDEVTKNLKEVAKAAKSVGAWYCYAAVPCQYAYHADDYPWYMDNWSAYTEEAIPQLRNALKGSDVYFLDVGEAFEKDGSPAEYSSSVDNHYGIEGAFKTYQTIMEAIQKETGAKLNILQEDDVVVETVPNPYLGSRERKLFGMRSLDEPLKILVPKKMIDFTRTDSGHETVPWVYALPADKQERVTYQIYMSGDMPQTHIDTGRDKLPSILIYGDSFTDAAECIFYNSFNCMDSLDMRYYEGGTVSEYIRKMKPDYVVCIRDYESLLSAEGNGGI